MTHTTTPARAAVTTIDRARVATATGARTDGPGAVELMLDSLETALAHLHAIDAGASPPMPSGHARTSCGRASTSSARTW